MLPVFLHLESVDHPEKSGNDKHIGKAEAEGVNPAQSQLIAQERVFPVAALGYEQQVNKCKRRDGKQPNRFSSRPCSSGRRRAPQKNINAGWTALFIVILIPLDKEFAESFCDNDQYDAPGKTEQRIKDRQFLPEEVRPAGRRKKT